MTPRLDRNRDFGVVLPENHFWQDGHYFDSQGNYLSSDGAAPAPETPAPKPETPAPETPAEIDLAAWAKGEKNYAFFSVVREVKETYPDAASIANKKVDVLAFLVSKGVVTEAEAVR